MLQVLLVHSRGRLNKNRTSKGAILKRSYIYISVGSSAMKSSIAVTDGGIHSFLHSFVFKNVA